MSETTFSKIIVSKLLEKVESALVDRDFDFMISIAVFDPETEKVSFRTSSSTSFTEDSRNNLKRMMANHLMGGPAFPPKELDEIDNMYR